MDGNTLRYGFIGLGNMGTPMSLRLLGDGTAVTVWNRNAAKAGPLVSAGAKAGGTPLDVLRGADIVGICLKDGAAVEDVVFGPGGMAAIGAPVPGQAPKTVVDFSTIEPDRTRRIAERLRAECGIAWLDAPVSGGVPGAETGTLICFVGGEAAEVDRARPFLSKMVARATHMGPTGAGQTAKICNQMIVAVNVLTIAEVYGLARRAGVAVDSLAEALQGGFADSKPLQIFGPAMAAHRFEPTRTAVELMSKDLGISQAMAAELGATTPVCAFSAETYQRIRARGDDLYTADVSRLVTLYE